MPSAAPRISYHNAFYECSNHAFAITCALPSSLLVRRFVRSTSAASRRDAERAKFKVQGPNLASKAFFDLKSLALKAYLKAKFEIEAKFAFPPSYNPSPQARTYRSTDSKIGG